VPVVATEKPVQALGAARHNEIQAKAVRRAWQLEPRLADILEPILDQLADTAASHFEKFTQGPLLASGGTCAPVTPIYGDGDQIGEFVGADKVGVREFDDVMYDPQAPYDEGDSVGPDTQPVQPAMVAVRPRPEQRARIGQLCGMAASDYDDMHVTLAYLPNEPNLERVVGALRHVAAEHAPMVGKVAGVGHFAKGDNGHPQIMLPSVPGLAEARVATTAALHQAGIDYSRTHGYVPHMTAGYYDSVGQMRSIRPALDEPVHFDHLVVARKGEADIEIPLTGQKPLTAAAEGAPPDADGEAKGSVPPSAHYHRSSTPSRSCGTCSYYGAGENFHCGFYDAEVGPQMVCDQWQFGVPVDWSRPWGADEPPGLTAAAVIAESEIGKQVGEVAERYGDASAPDYGDAWWNPKLGKVFWQTADYTGNEAIQDGIRDFDAISAVREVEACAECAPPEGADWEHVFTRLNHLTAAGAAGWDPPHANQLIDVDELVAKLRTKTDPVRLALIEQAMTPLLKEAGLDFDVTNPFTAKVLAQSGSQIVNIAETTQANVMAIVKKAYDEGLSIPDTAKAIRAGMQEAGKVRSTLIARTELAGAVNGGSLAAAQIVSNVTGQKMFKRWLTAPGAKYPRHEDYDGLDGQTVEMDAVFEVGDAELQFPGDPDGPPEEVCNC
jgi:2'-5' RNA ligase